jgi:hypothetical protein
MYTHWIEWGPEGDFLIYGTVWTNTADWEDRYVEISRWLIPGTQLED